MVAAMNVLDYDCGTLGNHEFNYGLDFLANSLGGGEISDRLRERLHGAERRDARSSPGSSSTATFDDESGAKQKIEDRRHRLRAAADRAMGQGAISTARRRRPTSSRRRKKHVPDLRKAGADIVVALCHSGIAGGERKGGEENAALHLAKVDGIDVILTGHQHLVFPGGKDFANIPGVDNAEGHAARQAGGDGGLLGQPSRHRRSRSRQGRASAWKVADFEGRGAADLRARRAQGRAEGPTPKPRVARRRAGRPRRDAEICARAGRHDDGADQFLLLARLRRRLREDRHRGAGLVRAPISSRRRRTRTCRCSRRRRRSRPAAAAARPISPTSSRVRSRSRTWRTSTSTRTPSAR